MNLEKQIELAEKVNAELAGKRRANLWHCNSGRVLLKIERWQKRNARLVSTTINIQEPELPLDATYTLDVEHADIPEIIAELVRVYAEG